MLVLRAEHPVLKLQMLSRNRITGLPAFDTFIPPSNFKVHYFECQNSLSTDTHVFLADLKPVFYHLRFLTQSTGFQSLHFLYFSRIAVKPQKIAIFINSLFHLRRDTFVFLQTHIIAFCNFDIVRYNFQEVNK